MASLQSVLCAAACLVLQLPGWSPETALMIYNIGSASHSESATNCVLWYTSVCTIWHPSTCLLYVYCWLLSLAFSRWPPDTHSVHRNSNTWSAGVIHIGTINMEQYSLPATLHDTELSIDSFCQLLKQFLFRFETKIQHPVCILRRCVVTCNNSLLMLCCKFKPKMTANDHSPVIFQ